jgi:hypothetical protein
MATLETPPELETPQAMTPWEPGQPELETPWAAPAKRPVKPAPAKPLAPTRDEAPFVDRAAPPMPEPQEAPPPPPPAERSLPRKEQARRQVCARNYVATCGDEYGVIDLGGGSLLIHAPPRNRQPWRTLAAIRPGAVLAVRRRDGVACQLRVRFTTPARYYSPGSRVTTLAVGVDRADWACLTAGAPRI